MPPKILGERSTVSGGLSVARCAARWMSGRKAFPHRERRAPWRGCTYRTPQTSPARAPASRPGCDCRRWAPQQTLPGGPRVPRRAFVRGQRSPNRFAGRGLTCARCTLTLQMQRAGGGARSVAVGAAADDDDGVNADPVAGAATAALPANASVHGCRGAAILSVLAPRASLASPSSTCVPSSLPSRPAFQTQPPVL